MKIGGNDASYKPLFGAENERLFIILLQQTLMEARWKYLP